MIGHTDLLINQPAVDDTGDLAVDGADEEILVADTLAEHAQAFCDDTRGHDVIKIFGMVEQRADTFDDHFDLFVGCFANEHIVASGQRDNFRFIGFQSDRRGTEFGFHFVNNDVILTHLCVPSFKDVLSR